jgi:hypothetical protein
MRQLFASIAIVCLALAIAAPQGATAGIGWCKSDPIVLIDGELADIFVSAPLHAPLVVTGPTQIVITLPVGIDGTVVLTDLGFGRGEQVRFVSSHALQVRESGIPVRIAVYVPATDESMPIEVEMAAGVLGLLIPERVSGTANTWTILAVTI